MYFTAGTALTNRTSKLKRTETMKALQRRATDYHRRKSLVIKPKRLGAIGTIAEDAEEPNDRGHLPVVR